MFRPFLHLEAPICGGSYERVVAGPCQSGVQSNTLHYSSDIEASSFTPLPSRHIHQALLAFVFSGLQSSYRLGE
jgi:hypothetical protein